MIDLSEVYETGAASAQVGGCRGISTLFVQNGVLLHFTQKIISKLSKEV